MPTALLLLAIALSPLASQLHVLPEHNKAILGWSSSDQVVNYRVHRGIKHGGPYTEIASDIKLLTYTDNSVVAGKSYYYVIDCSLETGPVATEFVADTS